MNYIDVKVTRWNRFFFAEQSNMEGLAKLIQEDRIEEVIDDKLGFTEGTSLPETEERITPDDNGGRSTIEVYANNELIWQNGNS